MTHCERILELLSDGKPHSHLELYALGTVAHSRVADLRARGYVIHQWMESHMVYGRPQRTHFYRLASAPSSANDSAPLPMRRPTGESAGEGGADGALAESSEGGPSGGPHEPRGLGDAMRPSVPSPSLDSEGGEQLALLAPEPARREMYA